MKRWTSSPYDLTPMAMLVTRFALAHGAPYSGCDDMVQEALIAGSDACSHCRLSECKGLKCGYVFRKMQYAIKDWQRAQNHLTRTQRKKVKAGKEQDIMFETLENLPSAPERNLCEFSIDIERCIRQLPKPGCQIIYRIYFCGCKARSIARDMKLTEGRVSQIHTKMLESLRKCLTNGTRLWAKL